MTGMITQRRSGLLLVAVFLLSGGIWAQMARAQTTTLTGHIEGIGNQPVIFWYDVDGEQQRDTVFATNDRFIYQPRPSDDGTINLFISPPRFTYFWYEAGQITVKGSAKTPYRLTFGGTPENEILDEYQRAIGWSRSGKKRDEATFQFIRDHPGSRTAANLLYSQLRAASKDNEIYQSLWGALSPVMQTSSFGEKAAQKIAILKTQPTVGRTAPNFTIPNTAGINVSLADFRGKYVLLDFWGHWCAPCIQTFPKVKALQEKYNRRLTMIGIALESANDKDKWLNAIRKHKANWTQLTDLQGKASETLLHYNITEYPTYMLLDKQGVVLERSSSLEAIERKLDSLGDF